MSTPRTYLFAGGGTGGHLFPGIAVAQQLQQTDPGARVLFVGSSKELEQSILARHQIDHRPLPVESLLTLKRRPFHFAIQNWRAWVAARRLIREVRPAAVIGLGGYASAPIVWAASRAKIPVVLLEQNVIPGRTTRWLSRSAALVCVSFPEAVRQLPKAGAVEVTGNPLRREIIDLLAAHSSMRHEKPRQLLVLGGSQGADSLNDAVTVAVRQLGNDLKSWRVVHQTGPRQADAICETYQGISIDATVAPFFDDMAERYRSASLVISRAGATTLAELTCCGLPMILLPFRHAADDHQRANARSLAEAGAAVVVEHRDTAEQTANELTGQLRLLLTDDARRSNMSAAALRLGRPDAAAIVASRIQALAVER